MFAKETMEDIFLRLLDSSYPLISNLRKAQPKMGKSLYTEAIELLRYENFDSGDDNAHDVVDQNDESDHESTNSDNDSDSD